MDTTAEIWATTQSLAMWHAFPEDSDSARCRSNIRARSAARFTWAETNRPFQAPRPHCEGCRKKLAAEAAEQAAHVKAAPAPADRRPDVVIPGALADILSGSNLATGDDDHDPASKATREALAAARRGRGRTLVIRPGNVAVLDVISRYADTILEHARDYTRAEITAARTWVDRAGHARTYYAKATQKQQIEAAGPLTVQEARARVNAAGARVRTNPDATDPDWRAALNELDAALEAARQTDPIAREALASAADAEAQQAAALITEAAADAGTWRGEWIGEQQPADVLFAIEGPVEQGALFGDAAPAEQPEKLVVRARFAPADVERVKAKAAADRAAWRSEMDARRAAEAARYGTPEQAPARRVVEGVIVEHSGTSAGSTPSHAPHPNVRAACEALSGLAVATLTDRHDVSAPAEEEQAVRGYMVEPREGRRVAVYWLEGGRTIRHDDRWHGAALDCLSYRLTTRGWTVEGLYPSSQCVFAVRPE
ncbi:hypothetical protein ACXNSR_18985 [Streptomyces sp. NC-S4]